MKKINSLCLSFRTLSHFTETCHGVFHFALYCILLRPVIVSFISHFIAFYWDLSWCLSFRTVSHFTETCHSITNKLKSTICFKSITLLKIKSFLHIFENAYIWECIYLRMLIFENAYIWECLYLRMLLFERK